MVKLLHRSAVLFFCLFLVFTISAPAAARQGNEAGEEARDKVVRVGWFESPFNTIDKSGRRSGYGYEYQLKLAAYTGWTYQYISGSWTELLQMLEKGEIDLLSDVSYKAEREGSMSFSSLPMGTEEYYLFIKPGNHDISLSDVSTLNGKRIGVNGGSIQQDFFTDWAQKNNISAELVELASTEDEAVRMLEDKELDAFVTIDGFTDPEKAIPIYKIGSSDFFFAVSKNRPDLLADINAAMNRIQDENRYYNLKMYEKYFRRAGANAFLSEDELSWLSSHGPIRLGYQDNYLAFCAEDKETGQLTGLMKDYLAYAQDIFVNAHLDFEATAYPTASAAMEALKNREVDCVFPSNLQGFEGEERDVIMSPPLMETEMYAVLRISDQSQFAKKETVKVAVNEGNPNYDAFVSEHYPKWEKVYYPDTPACLKAVSEGAADCILISNYRYNNIARLCEKYRLTTITTGLGLEYCLSVDRREKELYSILAKTVNLVPSSAVNAAVSYYISEDARLTISDLIIDNFGLVSFIVSAVMLIIFILLILNMQTARRAKKLISATETDELTGLFNRSYFFQYAERMYREHPDRPIDAISLDIEQFHSVNALNGRAFGDHVLRALGNEIGAIAKESLGIAGRFGGDHFDLYCRYKDDYQALFNRLQETLDRLVPNVSIRLRMGVMPWREKVDPEQLFDRAHTACSLARGHYKEHLIVFDQKILERELYEQRLSNDLRRALDNHEFEVYYQPKFDIQTEPPRLTSAEALIRWRHPELGMIPPGDFIPLFEKSGQISSIDKYVWAEAARQISLWRDQYGVVIPVSVNLSRVDVFDPLLEETLDNILIKNRIDHKALKLEVTESAYTENADQVIRVIGNLRKKGYEVEMDDFGTGYSSLNMLSSMPIDVLKMDREFIRNIEHNEKDIQLVALILDIAKNLRIPVIAEGVETPEQIRLLRELGCPIVQGYYFSRPLPSADFEKEYLQKGQKA